ncbi:hypothetical protein A4D02_14580 [Niastella koreensis]|uniref:TonB C-terminal domain-containing protein n=2 Tax=Niastella koreensis TaxID=354356 RepID=G8T979_NIAKG|nr:hypothetical protein [Niastella koreensis]AEV98047.1 hypothetical protein Niako_1682 [Niastella koreensis GR20-10]OQP40155.1 hypothetical protein A4D02_14580 [Niastella koreensis]
MKSFPLILLCFVGVANIYGQGGRISVEITKEKHKTYTTKVIPSDMADSSVVKVIERRLEGFRPVKNHLKKGTYIVSVNFILDKDGNCSGIACNNDPGFGLCAEVVRELKKYGKFGPAKVGE